MSELLTNLNNREQLIKNIKEELIGPNLDFHYAHELNNKTSKEHVTNNFYYWKYGGVKEEVLRFSESPQRKYASGLLYPHSNNDIVIETEAEDLLTQDVEVDEKTKYLLKGTESENETEIETQNQAHTFGESSFGITFAVPQNIQTVRINFKNGAYVPNNINKEIQGNMDWLFRKSLKSEYYIDFLNGIPQVKNHGLVLYDNENKVFNGLQMRLDVVTREEKLKVRDETVYLVTVTITNVTEGKQRDDQNISFQNELSITSFDVPFTPYPSASELEADIPYEDKLFDMLYSSEKNYSFGKNCSAVWDKTRKDIYEISSTFLPEHETYTISPDIKINGKSLEISHAELASVENFAELSRILNPLIEGYEKWLENIENEYTNDYYKEIKKSNIKNIQIAISRMEKGLEILRTNEEVFNIFKLSNLVMLMQMVNGKKIRKIEELDDGYIYKEQHTNLFLDLNFNDFNSLSKSIKDKISKESGDSPWINYKWRGFQIAFFLLSIDSIVNKGSSDRDLVDLIWFPTGGGKTEAYLAVSAFSMLYRRKLDNNDIGVDIIMRYTLRLLTADQFQRSSRLVCSLEYVRSKMSSEFGETEYSIGLWVGSSSTPNTIETAKQQYNKMVEGKTDQGFMITSCPWCGGEIKRLDNKYPGYKFQNNEFITHCPDKGCHFYERLPLYFIDEQIYNNRPSFLIGTIDKFVQLTWNPKVRYLFGLNKDGNRELSPPNLIIQDELHLISGPLGTLSGIYETLIEELSTDYRKGKAVAPKIISATATIKAYKNQIHALFGRENSALFPPTGIDINDNFFSTIKTNEDGNPEPGKKYVGVFTTTQGLLQTQVQVISRLIAEVNGLEEEVRDPFWTILSFYNSLREIGTTLSLTNQDIPHEIKNYYIKRGIKNRRYLNNTLELTSRISNDEVVNIIEKLKTEYTKDSNEAIDLTLASNIIEVGIDVDRLALMLINGQPRSTSQYIQVTGRIGRKPEIRPGLVFTLYNPQKSIDKSHYEHFTEYHQRLYGQVEESSVTPFSHYAIERGLPAVLIGYLRQFSEENGLALRPTAEDIKNNQKKISYFMNKIIDRATSIDSTEISFIREKAKEVLKILMYNEYSQWRHTSKKKGVLVDIGSYEQNVGEVIPMINTMRSVDAGSKLAVKANINIIMNDDDWGF